MIRIAQLKLPVDHGPEALLRKTARLLKVKPEEIRSLSVRRRSLDARKKPELYYSYTVEAELSPRKPDLAEKALIHKLKNPQITLAEKTICRFPEPGDRPLAFRPVIVGTGPAGLFCGLLLARHGYRPLLLERGEDVDARTKKVEGFWETGKLDPGSNVQFGEGGAGTFSDGKLNTLVKDPAGRGRLVLELFCEFGADPSILYEQKPHIGTDVLKNIVKRIRQEIVSQGGEVRFGCQMTSLALEDGRVRGVMAESRIFRETGMEEKSSGGEEPRRTAEVVKELIPAEAVILATGHSARDTFQTLLGQGVPMSPKAFAAGLRIQHPQEMINLCQYGRRDGGSLGAADYKLTWKSSGGRGVYSFCMCPGGYVVNASSEPGRLAVNGMSYHGRAGQNANSALIVTVTPEDFPDGSPLGGIRFQRRLEELAYQAAGGKIPLQLYEDFKAGRRSERLGEVVPQCKGDWEFADLREVLPEPLSEALLEAMDGFGRTLSGFDRPDALLAGVESRTSSPVRIWRDEAMESEIRGLYPCGEGAGYAGGIMSAAMDGIRTAEAVARRYSPPKGD